MVPPHPISLFDEACHKLLLRLQGVLELVSVPCRNTRILGEPVDLSVKRGHSRIAMCPRSTKVLGGVAGQEEVCAELDTFHALSRVQDSVDLGVVFEIWRVGRQEVADRLESRVHGTSGASRWHTVPIGESPCGTIAMVWHGACRRMGELVRVVGGVPQVGRPQWE